MILLHNTHIIYSSFGGNIIFIKLMKRLLSCFFVLCFTLSAFAADVWIDSIATSPAHCGTDGSITVYLGGTDAPDLQSVIYSAGNRTSSLNTIPGLSAGTYTVTVSGWLDNTPVHLTGVATVGGLTSYVSLNARIISIRDAMPDLPTGKITLDITQGRLPYTVEVWEGNTLIVSQTFTTNQSNYIVENVPAGNYTVQISDGCTNSYISVTVPHYKSCI